MKKKNSSDEYVLPDYQSNLNIVGRGKGIASYYKNEYKHARNINSDGISITKLESDKLDMVAIYRSQEGNVTTLIEHLESLITKGKTTLVGGDFNICAFAHPRNYITASLREIEFNQLVETSIHIEEGMIDHAYIKQRENSKYSYKV